MEFFSLGLFGCGEYRWRKVDSTILEPKLDPSACFLLASNVANCSILQICPVDGFFTCVLLPPPFPL